MNALGGGVNPELDTRTSAIAHNDSQQLVIKAGPHFTHADFAMALLEAGYDPLKPLDDNFTDWTVAVDDSGIEIWTLYK